MKKRFSAYSPQTISRAFTLIELLVVIAIIAVLTAILFPVFAQARQNARKAASLSNMKQVTLAVLMYAGDNDEGFPHVEYPENGVFYRANYWTVHHFQSALEPYIKNGRSVTDTSNVWWDAADPDRDAPFMWGSYLFNGFVSCTPRTLAEITQPSQTVYQTLRAPRWAQVQGVDLPAAAPPQTDPFWESDYFEMAYDPFDRDDSSSRYYWTEGRAIPPCILFPSESPCDDEGPEKIDLTRYQNNTLFSYLDGHVKTGRYEKTWRSASDNDWDVY